MDSSIMLLTDCLPSELPLIYSNKGFYNFVSNRRICENFDIRSLFEDKNSPKFTMTQPINFEITKNILSTRVVSLPHPLSQLYMVCFINTYDELLLNYFKQNNVYSIRYPFKKTSMEKKVINVIQRYVDEYIEDNEDITDYEALDYVDSYYIKKSFKKITNFYSSRLLKKFEQKYKYMLKMDYQDCFYRIYTHSIDWAYLGKKEIAKANIANKQRFSSILDALMQSMNYLETAGILVGPEFCRWVAEIVLCRIDRLVYDGLKSQDIIFKQDYDVVRFVDDIFIFANDVNILDKINKEYHSSCIDYKLAINDQKTYIENKPFIRKRYWVDKIKEIYRVYEKSLKDITEYTFEGIFQSQSDKIIDKIKGLIIDYEENANNIISYFLSVFQKNQNKTKNTIKDYSNEIKKFYYLQQLDILFNIMPYALTSTNVLKYIRCVKWIISNANIDSIDLSSEVYNQILKLIKYNLSKSNEMYNLLIVLSSFKKDVSENILIKILKDKHYFSIISVSYYIRNNNRKYKYNRVRKEINGYILEKINSLKENGKSISNIISTPDFLIIHDMYSSGILTPQVIQEADKLNNLINSGKKPTKDECYNIYFDYIKEFNNNFIQWNKTDIEIFADVIRKTMPNKIGGEISS